MKLRTRLVASFAGLLLFAVAITAVVATSVLRIALTAQVDDGLVEVARRGRAVDARTLVGGDEVFPRNIAVVVIGSGGRTLRSTPSGFGDQPDPLPDLGAVASAPEGLSTVPSEDGGFDYRMLVVRTPADITVVWASPLREVDRVVRAVARFLIFTAAVVLAAGVAATWWSVRRGLKPVDRMVDAANAIVEGDLSQRVETGNPTSEMGRLASAWNEMIAHLEAGLTSERASQERLRRFVADASHELRTPIAAIGGYAELYRSGGLGDEQELERAMDRVGLESARMHRLVEDLLVLARMDEGSELRSGTVDISELARGAVDDHRAIDPTRPVSLIASTPGLVHGDAERLSQVLAHLLSNVRTHTPEGTAVFVDVTQTGGSVVIQVADDGPGIPTESNERIFDRFYRVDPSRSRQRGGAGLGLSIVAAIVEAHGGTVGAGPSAAGGAMVTITLPAAGAS